MDSCECQQCRHLHAVQMAVVRANAQNSVHLHICKAWHRWTYNLLGYYPLHSAHLPVQATNVGLKCVTKPVFMHSPPSMPGNSNNQALLSNQASPLGNNQEPFSQVITVSKKKKWKTVNLCLCSRGPVHGTCQRWSFFLDLLVNATTEVCLWEAQWSTRQTSSRFSIFFFLPSSLAKNMRGVRTNKRRRHRRLQRWPRLMHHPLQPLLLILWVHLRQPVSKACKVKHTCSSY